MTLLGFAIAVAVVLTLGFTGAPLWLWTAGAAAGLAALGAPAWAWIGFGVLAVLFNVKPLRRAVVSSPIAATIKKLGLLPVISETESVALEAGTVWVDGEFFTGKPDFDRILDEVYPELTEAEQAFLDGPVAEVCSMASDWEIYQRKDLTPEMWSFVKEQGFLGMIIPEQYGGLGFSAMAHSAVITKLASHSIPLTVTTMVPNSLGPAELLLHYGTQEQKDHYLPRLARGEEIPCFALTEPGAGSDAGSMTSEGIVFRGEDGELYMRLNFRKRYITLAAISTLVGLAFRLRDPDNLLGKGEDLGITCALIPADTPGLDLTRRHDPLATPFYNCPVLGEDVVVSVNQIIGGPANAGNGWRMLMESLAAGRGISLPAQSTGGAMYATRVAGAYSWIRKQFGMEIAHFEGIDEKIAKMAGLTYLMDAARHYTAGAVDSGAKPAVVSAIVKYNETELMREVMNDAMDVLGGAAISRGPRNTLAHGYMGVPVGITVEGANILTRSMIVFGQGAIRCHPYAVREMRSVNEGDLVEFDDAFWGHIGFIVRNSCRALLLSLTRGRLAGSPVTGPTASYYRRLAWASATFAFLTDVSMGALGGDLKRREKLTGRLADILSWLYLGSATLRRFEAEGRRKEDLPLVHWAMQESLHRMEVAFQGVFANFPVPVLGALLRGPVGLWSRLNPLASAPSDELGARVTRLLRKPGEQRDRLTGAIHVPSDPETPLGRIEHAFELVVAARPALAKVKAAIRQRQLPKQAPLALLDAAVEAGILSADEAAVVRRAEEARNDAVQVDSFTLKEYMDNARIAEEPQRPELAESA